MRRRAVDWRDFGEDGLDLLEDEIDENAPVLRKYSRDLCATFAPTSYAPAGEVTIQYS